MRFCSRQISNLNDLSITKYIGKANGYRRRHTAHLNVRVYDRTKEKSHFNIVSIKFNLFHSYRYGKFNGTFLIINIHLYRQSNSRAIVTKKGEFMLSFTNFTFLFEAEAGRNIRCDKAITGQANKKSYDERILEHGLLNEHFFPLIISGTLSPML